MTRALLPTRELAVFFNFYIRGPKHLRQVKAQLLLLAVL